MQFLKDALGIYITPDSVLESITPRPRFNILDCIESPPSHFKLVRQYGLCWKCKEAKSVMSYCPACRKERNKERRMNRVANKNKCFCGQTSDRYFLGAFLCKKHYETDKAYLARDRAHERDDIGIQDRMKAKCKRYRANHKKRGLCSQCSNKHEPNHTKCAKCRAKHNGWK